MKVMIKPAMARPLGVRNTPITENIKPKTHRIQPSTGTQPRNNPNKAIPDLLATASSSTCLICDDSRLRSNGLPSVWLNLIHNCYN